MMQTTLEPGMKQDSHDFKAHVLAVQYGDDMEATINGLSLSQAIKRLAGCEQPDEDGQWRAYFDDGSVLFESFDEPGALGAQGPVPDNIDTNWGGDCGTE